MRRFSAILFLLFFCSLYVFGQHWQKVYQTSLQPDSNQIREFTRMVVCNDGHIALAGQSDDSNEANISLTKINAQTGVILWQKVLLRSGIDAVNQLIQTSDHGFALVGWISGVTPSDVDAIVVKCDSSGNFLWAKRIGDEDDDEAFGLAQLPGGDILVVGASYAGLNRNAFAVRLNAEGEQVWTKKYRQGNFNAFRSAFAVPSEPGAAVMVGYSWTLGPGSTLFDPFFVKIDGEGNILWARRKKQAGSQVLYGVAASSDGGFIYAGVTGTPTDNQALLGKVGANGDHVWAIAAGTPQGDRIWDVGQLPSGEIYGVGFTEKPGSVLNRRNAFIARFSSSGQWVDGQLIGADDTNSVSFTGAAVGQDVIFANALTYQHGFSFGAGLLARVPYLISGMCHAESFIMSAAIISTGDSSGAQTLAGPSIFDTDIDETITGDLNAFDICTINSLEPAWTNRLKSQFQVFPNPGTGIFNLESEDQILSFKVFGCHGILAEAVDSTHQGPIQINLSTQPKGIYFLRATTTSGSFSTTLVKE